MDDANINNEDEAAEQVRIAAAERRRFKSILVLEKKEGFSLRTRNKIDVLVEEFLRNLGDDVHDMISDSRVGENYRGLDSDRDTEKEIETTIRFFPDVLTTIGGKAGIDYPIQSLSNVKAISLIPLIAKLTIELGLFREEFEEQERGGLLCYHFDTDANILQNLMHSDPVERHNQEYHEAVDDKYLHVLIQLREMGLLVKEDIQRYGLLNKLCCNYHSYFSEKRFQFLVEWDPSVLLHEGDNGHTSRQLLIHYVSRHSSIRRGFASVFEAGIRYFPEKKGINILFLKNSIGKTPFQGACYNFGREKVMKVVEENLIRSSSSSSDNTSPFNVVDALVTAAIDENIHLDCVYFLIRREPDVLMKLLSYSPSAVAVSNDKNIKSNDTKKLNSTTRTTTERKRKRD
jgi:hypothetical protein